MKKFLLLGLIIISIIGMANAQTTTELKQKITVLEQKNKALEDKLTFCELYSQSDVSEVKSFNSNFEFKVLECRGNTNEQTVEIEVTIKHSMPNQKLFLDKSIAYGETGSSYEFKNSYFSESTRYSSFLIPTNMLIKGKLVYRNILPQTEKLSLVSGTFYFENKDGGGNNGMGDFEIRNLTIKWD